MNNRTRDSIRSPWSGAVTVDRLAVHVLEHEVRLRRARDAGIDKMGNARMAKARQQGAFAREPFLAGTVDEREIQQFDGGTPLEPAIAAFGQPHGARAALADEGEEAVGAHHLSTE